MISPETLAILRCPETRQPLSLATAADLAQVNQRITAGTSRNRAGKAVSQPLQTGLVREDHKIVYPVRDEIPVLLIEEGIPL